MSNFVVILNICAAISGLFGACLWFWASRAPVAAVTPRACCCRKGESENKDSNFGQAEQQIIAYLYKAA
jgi:hypothetical protein